MRAELSSIDEQCREINERVLELKNRALNLPPECLERVLRQICHLTASLPDPTVLACALVCRAWRSALNVAEFRPWFCRLVSTQIPHGETPHTHEIQCNHILGLPENLEGDEQRRILLSELWRQELDIAETEPPPAGCPAQIEPRMFSQAFFVEGDLHVVGGGKHDYAFDFEAGSWKEVFASESTVYRFDRRGDAAWHIVITTGELPPAHAYTSASAMVSGLHGQYLVLWLGGYYRRSYASCWALSLSDWSWSEVALHHNGASTLSQPRFFAASCLVGKRKIYAWGGRFSHGPTEQYFDELLELDLDTLCTTGDLAARTAVVPTWGAAPEAKFAASLCNVQDERLVLFGGAQWTNGGQCSPDSTLHILELATWEWTQLTPNRVPRPRLQHQSRLIGGGALLLVVGGYDGRTKAYLGPEDWAVLNLKTMEWVLGAHHHPEDPAPEEEEVDIGMDKECFNVESSVLQRHGWLCGRLPTRRAGVALATAEDSEVILFGGAQYVHKCWYRDMYELTFDRVEIEPDEADEESDMELDEALDSDDDSSAA